MTRGETTEQVRNDTRGTPKIPAISTHDVATIVATIFGMN